MPRSKPARKPGRNIAEAERNTVAVKVRLAPLTRDLLDAIAARQGRNRSETLSAIVGFAAAHGWATRAMMGAG